MPERGSDALHAAVAARLKRSKVTTASGTPSVIFINCDLAGGGDWRLLCNISRRILSNMILIKWSWDVNRHLKTIFFCCNGSLANPTLRPLTNEGHNSAATSGLWVMRGNPFNHEADYLLPSVRSLVGLGFRTNGRQAALRVPLLSQYCLRRRVLVFGVVHVFKMRAHRSGKAEIRSTNIFVATCSFKNKLSNGKHEIVKEVCKVDLTLKWIKILCTNTYTLKWHHHIRYRDILYASDPMHKKLGQ